MKCRLFTEFDDEAMVAQVADQNVSFVDEETSARAENTPRLTNQGC
jgi:hypothetical protein